jgi:UTP--glucose-1-phosphate uridylyltransferase
MKDEGLEEPFHPSSFILHPSSFIPNSPLIRKIMQRVTKGIIPAAGLGTRLHPITRVIPKEMFPVEQKPIIQHIVEEAITAGLTELGIIVRPGKEMIREYFSTLPEEELAGKIRIEYLYQTRPAGLGDAILCARDFIGVEPFIVMLPDDLYMDFNPTRELAMFFNERQQSCLSIGEVPAEEANCYGKVTAESIEGNLYRIGYMFPKNWSLKIINPAARHLNSFGRYVLTPKVLELAYERQEGIELDDGDLIRGLLRFETIYGLYLSCTRFDTGRFSTYVDAVRAFAETPHESGARCHLAHPAGLDRSAR